MSLDELTWMENENKLSLTQDQWIPKYNSANKIMASAPDIYLAFKENDPKLISSLKEDLNSWMILSTRISYNADDLEGTITHYYDSTVTETLETTLEIPVFRGTLIEEAISTGSKAKKGLAYLQAYFATDDSAEEIIKTLETASGKTKDKIKVWTANDSGDYSKAKRPERAGFLYIDYDYFHIYGNDYLYSSGRSRGVSDRVASFSAEGAGARDNNSEENNIYNINSGISKDTRSVHFSNTQQIGSCEKYTGMFCFENEKYVISLMRRKEDNRKFDDEKVSELLSGDQATKEKIGLFSYFNPTYVHISKYVNEELVDDSEGFK